MGGEIGVFSAGRGKGCTLWFSCKFEIPPNTHPPESAEVKKPSNPFEAIVAYKEEQIGTKLSKFISTSYSIPRCL